MLREVLVTIGACLMAMAIIPMALRIGSALDPIVLLLGLFLVLVGVFWKPTPRTESMQN